MYGSSAQADLNRSFPPMGSGLLRYRSAPSSLLAEICDDFIPDSDSIIARFLSSDLGTSPDASVEVNAQLPPPPQAPVMYQSLTPPTSDQVKNNGGTCSGGLMRQMSSPAGFLSQIDSSGYGIMRGNSSNNRLKRQGSMMSQISENESIDDWEDSKINCNFSPIKRARESGTEQQNGLSHQLSLPTEMDAMEKFLQFQDSVPCKIRAKRGCATHPRSIAERVRRTKISERMRKLQELVPNMDKQTNTADMLDLAVDYIKELQKQVRTISDSRANCTCFSNEQKPYTHPAE